jgi:hypothetical protein
VGTLAVIAAAGGSRGGLAIALTAGLLWSGYHLIVAARQRTRRRHFAEAHRERRRAELEKILQNGMARVKRVKAVSVVELAAFEDEGPGYVFDLGDGRVLFVKGQDFASPDDDGPWPNTEFEIVRAAADGTMLGLRCHGALLRPMRVIPASIVDPQKGWEERPAIARSPSRPLLRPVQDANDVNRVLAHGVDHDVGQWRHDEFACALLLAKPAAVRERQQRGGRSVQGAHETLRMTRGVLEEVVCDSFEIRGRLLGPPKFHQRRD